MNLGAKPRDPQLKILDLGTVQSPSALPATYVPQPYAIQTYYQGDLPTCGAHAGASFQSTLRALELSSAEQLSPFFLWKELKTLDGIPPEEGTDMPSIFRALQTFGICSLALMPDDINLSLANYTDPTVITSAQIADAETREVTSDAYLSTITEASLKQAIYKNGAVLLLVRLNDEGGNWFGNPNPVFDPAKPYSGHFVNAYGYNEGILITDSADEVQPLKTLNLNYLPYILEAGTVIDLPIATARKLLAEIPSLQQEVQDLIKQVHDKLFPPTPAITTTYSEKVAQISYQ